MKYFNILTISILLLFSSCSKKDDNNKQTPETTKKTVKPAMKPAVKPAVKPAMKPAVKPEIKKDKKQVKQNKKVEKTVALKVPKDAKTVKKPYFYKTFKKDNVEYYVMYTAKYKKTAKIKGYAAPIPLEIFFDKTGAVKYIEILKNKETPDFIENIKKTWLPKIYKLKPDDPIIGKKGVDALSESTLSTEAIKKTVSISRKILMEKILKTAPPKNNSKNKAGNNVKKIKHSKK